MKHLDTQASQYIEDSNPCNAFESVPSKVEASENILVSQKVLPHRCVDNQNTSSVDEASFVLGYN